MKNTLIIAIVLVLVGLGVFVFTRNDSEAPTLENGEVVTNNMPAPGFENTGVVEMVVNESGEAAVREFTVDGKNFSFTPNVMNVKKGDLVKITFKNSQGFHDLVIDEYKVATKQIKTGEQETISFIADKTGSFEYYCSVGTHRAMGMKGTLVVTE